MKRYEGKKLRLFFLQILKFMSVKRKRPLPSRNCSRQTCFLDKRPCDTLSALVNRTQVRLLGKEGVSNSICFSFFFVKRRWQSVSALENRFISQSRVKKHQGHVLMVPKRLEGPGFKGKRPRAERLSNSERPGKRYVLLCLCIKQSRVLLCDTMMAFATLMKARLQPARLSSAYLAL